MMFSRFYLIVLMVTGAASVVDAADSCRGDFCGMNSYQIALEDTQGRLLLDSSGKRIYEDRVSIFDLEEWSSASRFDGILIRKSGTSGLRVQLGFESKGKSQKTPPLVFELEESDLDIYLEAAGLDFSKELRAFSEQSGALPLRFSLAVVRKADSKILVSKTFRILPLH